MQYVEMNAGEASTAQNPTIIHVTLARHIHIALPCHSTYHSAASVHKAHLFTVVHTELVLTIFISIVHTVAHLVIHSMAMEILNSGQKFLSLASWRVRIKHIHAIDAYVTLHV